VIVLPILSLTVPGCGKSKVTMENYDKTRPDMTLSQVEAILGPGTKNEGDGEGVALQFGVNVSAGGRSGGGEAYTWEDGSKTITVYFRQGKVVNKQPSGL
jgi:hypothetical protein